MAEERERPRIIASPEQIAGVWANMAEVTYTVHEFTIDFFRLDPAAPRPGKAVLVARVALSPVLTQDLIDLLAAEWAEYTRQALPREIFGDGEEEAPG